MVSDKQVSVMQFKNNPKVAVFMVAYNHADWIKQAVEGVLMQETNFPVKLFIGEDYSTDDTREICLGYKEKYPDKIELILNKENIGSSANALNIYKKCFEYGDYTAMCEGDDYWTDKIKLQKQVDFLEANSDFSGCFHRFEFIYENSDQESRLSNENQKEVVTFEDLILRNCIGTASLVYRNNLFNLPDWFNTCPIGDLPLFLLVANCGKIGFLDETMSAYRIHDGGIWTNASGAKRILDLISVFKECRRHFYPRANVLFLQRIASFYKKLLFNYFKADSYKDYRKHYLNCVLLARHFKNRYFIHATVWYLLSYSPFLAARYKQFKNI